MQMITRRSALVGVAFAPTSVRMAAAAAAQVIVSSDDGDMGLSRYTAAGTARRPAVFLLHGARGVEMKPTTYERHAGALTAAGIGYYMAR